MTLDQKFDLILSELRGMKSEISGMKSEISGMKSEISGMKSEIFEMKSNISNLNDRMDNLEKTVQKHYSLTESFYVSQQETNTRIFENFDYLSSKLGIDPPWNLSRKVYSN